jgi:VIT1/CCC1 family predicted Fe2+/Mn2+ transporter
LSQILDEMPARWLYLYIGFIVGVILGLVLIAVFRNNLWAQIGALMLVLFLSLVGRVLGQAEDWRKKL